MEEKSDFEKGMKSVKDGKSIGKKKKNTFLLFNEL